MENSLLPDYKDDPNAYEEEERARPDEMAMIQEAGVEAIRLLDTLSDAAVLDLCCGTGLSMEAFVEHQRVSSICGVDISEEYLAFARARFSGTKHPPVFICGDVVTAEIPQSRWDVIMMASAYHHIDDGRKIQFLRRVEGLLRDGGYGIMAENILPLYQEGDDADYARAVTMFYKEVLKTAEENNPSLPEHVRGLIQRVAQYGTDGEYEYKVCKPIFDRHIQAAGLRVVSERRVWPLDGPLANTSAGNYVVIVQSGKH
jgi:SAM-dependent methyltransferase